MIRAPMHIFNRMPVRRPDDMPMTATVERQRKGVYLVTLKFTKSGRIYDELWMHVATVKAARAGALKLYPTLKWSKKR